MSHVYQASLKSAAGFVVPIIMGSIIQSDPYEPGGWATFWYISAASAGLGLFIYLLFGSAKQQESLNPVKVESNGIKRNIIDEIE